MKDIKNMKVGKVDESIDYRNFSAPAFDIYNEKMNKKMAEEFMQMSPKTTREAKNNAKKSR